MRFFPLSLGSTLLATLAIAQAAVPEAIPVKGALGTNEKVTTTTEAEGTVFNGIEVPTLLEMHGEKFDEQAKSGYWFVKHYSPDCPHCRHIAPTWQTLYEFYYTSKPVPGDASDSSISSLNSFTSYYDFHFGSLSCLAFGTACRDHEVTSFPTFTLFKDGKLMEVFDGIKNMEELSAFIELTLEHIKPGSRVVGGPTLPSPGAKEVTQAIGPESPKGSTSKPLTDTKGTTSDPLAADTKDSVAQPLVGSKDSTYKPLVDTKGSIPVVDTKTSATAVDPKKPIDGIANPAISPVEDADRAPAKPKSTLIANPFGKSISFTAESFQEQVTMSQDPWFIKFYAPWCHHCQAMAPNWVQLGKEMKHRLNIGEVNCEVERALCKDVGVRGYPTILFFRGGERVEYEGLRGLGDFVSYANKATEIGEGVKDVDAAEFKEMEETEEVIFVYFYDHATTSEDFAALEKLTLSLIGHAKLVRTSSSLLAERFKITTWPRLLVSRDGRPTYYTALAPQDMRTFNTVLNWMQSVWLPIVPELTTMNSQDIMEGKLVVLGIFSRERPDEFITAKKEMKSAALEWMDKQTANFQRERQELRDAKQLRIEEAEDRDDQRALRAAKSMRIDMSRSEQKEVVFAWVDAVFWERWLRTTYGIDGKQQERVVINDEDNRRYWDMTINGNPIMASRTSILETIPKVVVSPALIQAKSTISSFEKLFFDIRTTIRDHPILSAIVGVALGLVLLSWNRNRSRSRRGGFFRLDEKDGLLGGPGGPKSD